MNHRNIGKICHLKYLGIAKKFMTISELLATKKRDYDLVAIFFIYDLN